MSFFLFGPRGTGKSTWLRDVLPGALFIDLLDPEEQRALGARPERLRERVNAAAEGITVVVDEVQKVPTLLDVVHSLIEARRGSRFVLAGSSARKLRRGSVDLLAGRAALCRMHPLMASEMGARFDLERALQLGTLPVVVTAGRPREALRSYVALYVREEVQMEGLVRSIGQFSRFLEAVSFSHGAVLNVTNISRECEVGRKAVDGYLGILDDLLLAFRVPVFEKRAKRATTHHPKFYLVDVGVFRSLRPAGPLDRPQEIEGAALEGLVAQHLRAWRDYGSVDCELYFWRSAAGSEVDFVVYGSAGFWAIEVKNTRSLRPGDLRPMNTFLDDYPECRGIVLHRGGDREVRGRIHCIPCDAFLANLRPGAPLI